MKLRKSRIIALAMLAILALTACNDMVSSSVSLPDSQITDVSRKLERLYRLSIYMEELK